MAWDVTVPDTYAESHIGSIATKPGAAAQKRAQKKINKYMCMSSTHIFYPFAYSRRSAMQYGIVDDVVFAHITETAAAHAHF